MSSSWCPAFRDVLGIKLFSKFQLINFDRYYFNPQQIVFLISRLIICNLKINNLRLNICLYEDNKFGYEN